MAAAADGLLLATDVADLLVEHGVPFRRAHEMVGSLVRHCLATGTALRDLDDATLRRHAPRLDPALVRGLTPARSVARRRVVGGGRARGGVRARAARAAREARAGTSPPPPRRGCCSRPAATSPRRWLPSWCSPAKRPPSRRPRLPAVCSSSGAGPPSTP